MSSIPLKPVTRPPSGNELKKKMNLSLKTHARSLSDAEKSLFVKVVKCNRTRREDDRRYISEVASAVAVWKAWKARSFRWYRQMVFRFKEILADPRLLRQC